MDNGEKERHPEEAVKIYEHRMTRIKICNWGNKRPAGYA